MLQSKRRIHTLETSLTDMNEKLKLKIDDLEGHSRHNNIKIVGVPEGKENSRPTEFITGIPKLLRTSK